MQSGIYYHHLKARVLGYGIMKFWKMPTGIWKAVHLLNCIADDVEKTFEKMLVHVFIMIIFLVIKAKLKLSIQTIQSM